jgi:hypothetical protein
MNCGSLHVLCVADQGSGAFLTIEPGSRIGFLRISNPGPQAHIFDSLVTKFWVKSTIILNTACT